MSFTSRWRCKRQVSSRYNCRETSTLRRVFMSGLLVEGTYENGVIKPDRPLPRKEDGCVRFAILDSTQVAAALAAVERTYGLIPWTGDPEVLRQIAEEPEFGIAEAP